jgi:hypothetical protein
VQVFERRLPERVDGLVMPASENLHMRDIAVWKRREN